MGKNPESRAGTPERSAEGLLYVEVECPAELEAEFHAWYNQEHIPERLRIPGFVSGTRYVALEGGPRWLAAYGLDNPGVLESVEYRKWAGPLQTPWTKRMVSSTRVRRSVFRCAHRLSPGDATAAIGLLAVRYVPAPVDNQRLHDWHDHVFSAELTQVAGVLEVGRYEDTEQTSEELALYYLRDPWIIQKSKFARLWVAGWEQKREGLADYKRTVYIRIL
jgi:hypothetical protein